MNRYIHTIVTYYTYQSCIMKYVTAENRWKFRIDCSHVCCFCTIIASLFHAYISIAVTPPTLSEKINRPRILFLLTAYLIHGLRSTLFVRGERT